MGACEGGVVGPGGGLVGEGAEEEVDEEGGRVEGGFVDADVDKVLVVCCRVGFGGGGCVGVAFGDGALWVVEGVELGADVGRELGRVDTPVDNFWVGVAKCFGISGCCGGVDLSGRCAVKWCQGCIDILHTTWCSSKSAKGVSLRSHKGIRVYGLPDCEQTINVSTSHVSFVQL